MPREWTPGDVLAMARGYQEACVLMAGAELDVFGALAERPMTAEALATRLGADLRGTAVLLDALAAMELLEKHDDVYRVPPTVADVLAASGSRSVTGMVCHLANCLRRWGRLAEVVKQGGPADQRPSIRGAEGDRESFIEAMNDIHRASAAPLVAELGPLSFRHLLDVGGGSGTWTIAFLRAVPGATATLVDLPEVIPIARRRLADEGLGDRVTLVAGDYNADPLPGGADFAWVSAIFHQNSREQNRALAANVFRALEPGGRIAVRDIVMESSRTAPRDGALFAVNMLVATPGGTWTFDEIRSDLLDAGFADVSVQRREPAMNSTVVATRPSRR